MNNLREARKALGYTQCDIAEILTTEQTHYSKYELERNQMGIDKYKQLALFYNVSIDYLSGLTDTPRTLTGISWQDNIYINHKKKRAGK